MSIPDQIAIGLVNTRSHGREVTARRAALRIVKNLYVLYFN